MCFPSIPKFPYSKSNSIWKALGEESSLQLLLLWLITGARPFFPLLWYSHEAGGGRVYSPLANDSDQRVVPFRAAVLNSVDGIRRSTLRTLAESGRRAGHTCWLAWRSITFWTVRMLWVCREIRVLSAVGTAACVSLKDQRPRHTVKDAIYVDLPRGSVHIQQSHIDWNDLLLEWQWAKTEQF